MVAVPASERDQLRRVLDDDGAPLPGARLPAIPDATLTRMFEVMTLTRLVDLSMRRLPHQGPLDRSVGSLGEEASHLAAAPLRASDWVFPSCREPGAWFWRGYTIQQVADQLLGNEDDPVKGRQVPVHPSASWLHLVSVSSPVGTQIPQAVGAAYAARMLGKDDVAMAFFGDGASSTGAFHVGLNFAGVWKAPCVFVCRSGGWANRAPSAAQAAARTLAARAIGYGMPGVRVDGNDALAVWQAASEAIDRARAGGGPTLIEAVTCRLPDRAGDPSGREPEVSRQDDPLGRLRGYLRHRGLSSERWEAELSDRCHQQIAEALAAAQRKRTPAIETLFDDVYDQLPWHLREQRAYLTAQAQAADHPRATPTPPGAGR